MPGDEKIFAGSTYLERLHMTSFGTITDRTIGPFQPKMNVVFGKNEAGKTTITAFIGGVLFGWEGARGGRNTYKPRNAERMGSLFFVDRETGEEFELSRSKNAEGLKGHTTLVDDLDKDTFQTMFALTSDELRSLEKTTDVTAKLLTAGSGTGASPAQAQSVLQERIAEYTSRATGIDHSLVQLNIRLDQLRDEMAEAAEAAERYKHQDKEFHEIEPQRETLIEKLQKVNSTIEDLSAAKATLGKLEDEIIRSEKQKKSLFEEQNALASEKDVRRHSSETPYIDMNADRESAIRDGIEALAEDQGKREHGVSLAEDDYVVSKANYEAFLEADDVQELERKGRRQRKTQVFLSILLPLLFILAGVPVFMHGRAIGSLSFTALGLIFVVFALFLAGAALVMLFRPNKTEEATEQRKKDLQWVMLQDKKKLEAVEEALYQQEQQAADYLDSAGLGAAEGSLRRARLMLDDIKSARAASDLIVQKQQALAAQLSALEDTLGEAAKKKEALLQRLSLPPDADMSAISDLIGEKSAQRTGLMEMSENINRRYGELKQELSHARHATRFDGLKLEYQQIKTRVADAENDLARFLLARHMLEAAISAWESKSQPEVYRRASRLLSLMTAGKWVQVRMTEEGRLQVIDNVKTKREPIHLSLGTCQQLYLSLRIALLVAAENVGRTVPIMADDILVNFDEERRRGAAAALKELSDTRQVIIFTSQKDIVGLMQDIDPQLNLIEL